MRREILYLTEIIEATDHIARFIDGMDFEQFQESELVRSAVVQKLSIIGEAAARVPQVLRTGYPMIAWSQMIGFRNVLVHGYFGLKWTEVWLAARNRCPELRDQISQILAMEFPNDVQD